MVIPQRDSTVKKKTEITLTVFFLYFILVSLLIQELIFIMEAFLYTVVALIAQIHNYIMTLNDQSAYGFTDKELHFIVIGILGILLLFVIHPLFRWLSNTGHIMVVSFFYVFTVIIVITFAIEIGQGVTNTGNMDIDDIAYGVMGFLAMFVVFLIIRGIYLLIRRYLSK